MFGYVVEHINILITAITSLIAAITSLILVIKEYKRRKIRPWSKLKDHPLLPALLSMINRGVPDKDIASPLKRKMVEDSLKARMRGWYNAFMQMIALDGTVEGGHILSSGKVLSDWYYKTISTLHKEQLETFPRKYVDAFFSKFITKSGEITANGVGEIYDNHNDLYKNDFDKMWAIMSLTQDTLSFLYAIAIETANDMNGELENELIRLERVRNKR